MADPQKLVRIASFRSVADFLAHSASCGVAVPCDSEMLKADASPLAQPVPDVVVNGKRIGNRCCVHPMEGWDGTTEGGITPEVVRRWQRFGESGAGLIYGGEAMAVRPDGRANPNQLIIQEAQKSGLATLRGELLSSHREMYGAFPEPVIGFQLTHSGRFCKPNAKTRFEPRVAYRHPILDRKFGVLSDEQVWSDSDLDRLIEDYVAAAKIAWDVGADFVDIKHCHGYLLHELLGAHTRPGKYGGSFENRTRFLRDTLEAIRASGNRIDFGVRLSAFDFVPFRPDPALSSPGKPGPGIPEDYSGYLPYRFGFGVNPESPVEPDLKETFAFVELCGRLGVKLLNVTAGSPYYNPHIQRPAAYPPSDGYQPPEDPLVGVARQIEVTRQIKARAPREMVIIGTGYSYLQEYLVQVAQATVREQWTDMAGIGRMVLSYPRIFMDALQKGEISARSICRTFSDCTTAPRNGMISGCYPLDRYYTSKPEFQKLKELKKG